MPNSNPWELLVLQASELLSNALKSRGLKASVEEVAMTRSIPSKEEFGDLSFSCCLPLAKQAKLNPRELAMGALSTIELEGTVFEKAEVAGPGYVNFFIDTGEFGLFLQEQFSSDEKGYGGFDALNGKKAIIEFPGVNPGKPLHVGHLRNAVLGESIARLFEARSCEVVRMDYIDDLGLQVAKVVWGAQNQVRKEDKGQKLDHWQGLLYVDVERLSGEKPEVEEQVRKVLKDLEDSKSKTFKEAEKIVLEGVKAQHETTQRLGIMHDVMVFESDIVHSGLFAKTFEELKKSKDVVVESEGKNKGCAVVKLSHLEEFQGMENPDKIIVRSDGTTTYTGKDIAFHYWKFDLVKDPFSYDGFYEQSNGNAVMRSSLSLKGGRQEKHFNGADFVVNVIGSEQAYPQKVVKYSLKLLGHERASDGFRHLAYGLVDLPEGAISGRSGNATEYSADAVLDTAVEKVEGIIREKNPELFKERGEQIAETVGVGAVKFAMLRVDAQKNITFKWDDVLDFEGQTAPYVQYAFARCSRILEKAPLDLPRGSLGGLATPAEKSLLLALSRFPSVVLLAGEKFEPFKLCEYLVDLTGKLNAFYRDCPVLSAETPPMVAARLQLVRMTRIVLGKGLYLLGIGAPERM